MSRAEAPEPFEYDPDEPPVEPGAVRHFHYPVGETYLGRPVELPVTIVNGERDGPRLYLSAAVHGDEVNGVKVLQDAAPRYDPAKLHGTLVCIHVVNVPGFIAQQRYLPIYDQDLNRAFPGSEHGTTAARMAHIVYDRFVSNCDMALDFHTSTRNRMTLFHVRADWNDDGARELADAFGAPLVLSGGGAKNMMRRIATESGIPTLTVEMGEANRFQPLLIEMALQGIDNVLGHYGMYPDLEPTGISFRKVLTSEDQKTWIRADHGGLVEMT